MEATLKACLNGDRSRADHPGVPVTPAELAQSAYDAAVAGAVAVHFHPRGDDGRESLHWSDVGPAVGAVRVRVLVEALPGISPGVDGVAAAKATLEVLPGGFELVVHGENEWAWPVLGWARSQGYGLRAGFEDMLTGPGGETVTDNGQLVAYMRGNR